jgi:hypothetical protein
MVIFLYHPRMRFFGSVKIAVETSGVPWNGGVHVYIRMRAAFAVEQENAAAKISALRETY